MPARLAIRLLRGVRVVGSMASRAAAKARRPSGREATLGRAANPVDRCRTLAGIEQGLPAADRRCSLEQRSHRAASGSDSAQRDVARSRKRVLPKVELTVLEPRVGDDAGTRRIVVRQRRRAIRRKSWWAEYRYRPLGCRK